MIPINQCTELRPLIIYDIRKVIEENCVFTRIMHTARQNHFTQSIHYQSPHITLLADSLTKERPLHRVILNQPCKWTQMGCRQI